MLVCVVVLISTFRCPEVGLDFSFSGVQRLDYNFHFLVSRGWIRIFTVWCAEVGLEFSLDAPPRKKLDRKAGNSGCEISL